MCDIQVAESLTRPVVRSKRRETEQHVSPHTWRARKRRITKKELRAKQRRQSPSRCPLRITKRRDNMAWVATYMAGTLSFSNRNKVKEMRRRQRGPGIYIPPWASGCHLVHSPQLTSCVRLSGNRAGCRFFGEKLSGDSVSSGFCCSLMRFRDGSRTKERHCAVQSSKPVSGVRQLDEADAA